MSLPAHCLSHLHCDPPACVTELIAKRVRIVGSIWKWQFKPIHNSVGISYSNYCTADTAAALVTCGAKRKGVVLLFLHHSSAPQFRGEMVHKVGEQGGWYRVYFSFSWRLLLILQASAVFPPQHGTGTSGSRTIRLVAYQNVPGLTFFSFAV